MTPDEHDELATWRREALASLHDWLIGKVYVLGVTTGVALCLLFALDGNVQASCGWLLAAGGCFWAHCEGQERDALAVERDDARAYAKWERERADQAEFVIEIMTTASREAAEVQRRAVEALR